MYRGVHQSTSTWLVSEDLDKVKNELLGLLINIRVERKEQLNLQNTLIETQGRYREASKDFEEMVNWQDRLQPTPTSLPVYSKRERLRYRMLFDTNKPLFMSVCSTQGVVADTCAQLWKNANDLITEAGIQPLQSIDETTFVSTRAVEVEDLKKASQTSIQI
jgi:hypothetical protein